MINFEERALSFSCNGSQLYGVISGADHQKKRGVLIIVGGPQYRAGSHRQFTLLARYLASQGIPCMRFDYRGMGDSDGDARTFEDIHDDIFCAINEFIRQMPALKEIVLWGLCDAASAAAYYAHQDNRVGGLVLLNPWVTTTQGKAKAVLKHYYIKRLRQREFWSRLATRRLQFGAVAQSFWQLARDAFTGKQTRDATMDASSTGPYPTLPQRVFDGLCRFEGRILLVLSENDLTAKEFSALMYRQRRWKKLLRSDRVQQENIRNANHTFSSRDWRAHVEVTTAKWLQSW